MLATKFLFVVLFALWCVPSHSAATVLPIPPINVSFFSGAESINNQGSFNQCCSGGFTGSVSSNLVRWVNNVQTAQLTTRGSCRGWACDCYDSNWGQSFVDVTPLYSASCKNATLNIQCQNADPSCPPQYFNFSYVNVTKGLDGHYWPSPLNGSCSDPTGFDCMSVQYRGVQVPCVFYGDYETCKGSVPLPAPSTAGEAAALILTTNSFFGDGCGNMECNYGGSGRFQMSCTFSNITCA